MRSPYEAFHSDRVMTQYASLAKQTEFKILIAKNYLPLFYPGRAAQSFHVQI